MDLFIKRNISERLERALSRSPVVLLTGARQTGKTTLIKVLGEKKGYSYVTFDDLRYLSGAKSDPIGFISALEKPVILDEVQRVPEFFLSIKSYVDKNRKAGIFALTGSANPLLIPRLGDSLAGRMEILELFSFSQAELLGKKEKFVDFLFSNKFSSIKASIFSKEELCKKLVIGGYPSVQDRDKEGRMIWFDSYLTTILQRDVRDLAKIEGLTQLPDLLHLLSTRVGSLLNVAELSRSSGIASMTLHRYITLLKTLFIILFHPVWSTNLGKRLVKSPKVYLMDVGVLLHLLKADKNRLLADATIFARVFENFVIVELLKQTTWSDTIIKMFHYRTVTGIEVDVVLEDASGKVVGIEIKSGETIISDDFKGLKQLQKIVGKNFVAGIILYMGTKKIPFGENLWAMPVSSLWS